MNSMSDKCFVDTNILVYAHDRSAGVKHQRAQIQQGFLFESSIVTVNHFDYTANGGGFRATQLRERSSAVGFCE
jgi:hypothetical protein